MLINRISSGVKWMGKELIEKTLILVFLLIHPEVPDWIKTAIFGTVVYVLGKIDGDKIKEKATENCDDEEFEFNYVNAA